MPDSFYARRGKRLFDLTASLCGIVALSPLFLLLTLLVKFSTPGPVFFRHRRVGRNFESFLLYKFRTMTWEQADGGADITVGGDARITPVGRLLRRTKLDELPQLLNVLRGEMSVVGPRPEVPRYVELFRKDYESILSVSPGITDYAAVEYRDEEAVLAGYKDPKSAYRNEVLPAKIGLYKRYIADISFLTDIKLIFRTLNPF